LRALVSALCLLAAGGVAAQRADAPAVRVGDQWHFVLYYTVPSVTPNRDWMVTAVGAGRIEGTENGEPLRLTSELGVLGSPLQRHSNPKPLAFPLFKPKGSKGTAAVEVVVTAYEKVSVPAGEFQAFKLIATERLGGTSPVASEYAGDITRAYWYAPAARAIVKSVTHNPYLGRSTVELVKDDLRR